MKASILGGCLAGIGEQMEISPIVPVVPASHSGAASLTHFPVNAAADLSK